MVRIKKFFQLYRTACWRAFQHDAFGIAKGAAYSLIFTMFPALLLSTSILAAVVSSKELIDQITAGLTRVFPPGTGSAVIVYFESAQERPIRVLILASIVTLWSASGVMMSWMEGFRNAYQLPKVWGIVKERMIAFGLVVMAGIPLAFATVLVAFGNEIEQRIAESMAYQLGHEVEPYILMLWTAIRWIIASITGVAVMALIYHHAVPRTQRWHSVLAGSALATAMWFPATFGFGWYVRHIAQYSLFYGSLAAPIVLLVWLYIISIIVLIGAELNALLYPRTKTTDTVIMKPGQRIGAR